MTKVKNVLSLLLCVILAAAGLELTTISARAAADTLTPISSIQYDFTVTGTSGQTSLEYTNQATNWMSYTEQFAIDGDGDYSLTLNPQADGLTNLGHFTALWGSTVMVTLNKVTVNGTYAMTFENSPVANLGTGNPNGYANIWNTGTGTVICSGTDCRLEYTDYNTGIAFYVQSGGSGGGGGEEGGGDNPAVNPNRSLEYVAAMGHGWNLGNSFDGFEGDLNTEDTGELAWSNPAVTRELLAAVKAKGFDSVRIPMTVHRRYTVNANAGANDYKYVINTQWLARYKQVVDWAVEEGLYVMINIHHDSWIWLQYWDGSTSSEEYRMFTDFWKQISAYFADASDMVCFETINEPAFTENGGMTQQQKLDALNRAAYDIIRQTEGNETRMIVFPTLITNHEKSPELYQFLQTLNDINVIATIHYYSDWVFSANLGKTGFDEELWKDDNGESYTPRKGADIALKLVYDQFVTNKIGVVIGEYGILGYDRSDDCNEMGEELKYYEYVNELARQYGLCLMFWDNGSGIDRLDTVNYSWKKAIVGSMLEESMTGRSSYAAGLDNIYFKEEAAQDVSIPLTLNGNTFTGINGLSQGSDYTYDASTATVTLKKEYINRMYNQLGSGYGTFATLVFTFSSGADWYEYLVKYAAPVFGTAQGTTDNISIPVTFNGSKLRRITAYQTTGRVGPNSDWWSYLQYDDAFTVDYQNGKLAFTSNFFGDSTVHDGLVKAVIEFYDGQFAEVWMNIEGSTVTSSPSLAVDTADIGASEIICLYAGETEIPSQYLYMPEGGAVYGTWVEDSSIVQMTGWPAVLIFDTVAHDNFTIGGLVLYYMDAEVYANVQFGIKDAPVVTAPAVSVGGTGSLSVSNLVYDAAVAYETADTSIAEVNASGLVTGKSAGTTTVLVTVTQYNRTDTFTAELTVS